MKNYKGLIMQKIIVNLDYLKNFLIFDLFLKKENKEKLNFLKVIFK